MRTEDKALMTRGIKALGLDMDDFQIGRLESFLDEIEKWNPAYGLVKAQGSELVIKHVLDCLAAVPFIQKHEGEIADLGSGAGLPGIVLAIAMPDRKVFLIERMQRRVGFLRNALAVTGLVDRVSIIDRDIKEIGRTFSNITFRAFHPLSDIMGPLCRLTSEGSAVFAYKGDPLAVKAELEQCSLDLFKTRIELLKVPFLDASRCLLILDRNELG